MPPRSQVRAGRPEYLLELRLNGTPYRFGSIPLRVSRADGTTTTWQEGLVAVEGLPRSADSAAVTIASGSVDWARLASRGQDLGSARATLYRWWAGQVLEEAEVVLEGGSMRQSMATSTSLSRSRSRSKRGEIAPSSPVLRCDAMTRPGPSILRPCSMSLHAEHPTPSPSVGPGLRLGMRLTTWSRPAR